ncbi:hypothetical protein GCM10010140_05070 [Streptosporangium pseudovulgare]|uniref:Uncharacterized protein n=1 Tax=Streptosporangium pseudovulgare TaxID=35765 RepID=A0ABQ2QFL5_9ACTN|nr:hypothetical protein GCM10010140_05070 [Streptosporangium pseudovulgare]
MGLAVVQAGEGAPGEEVRGVHSVPGLAQLIGKAEESNRLPLNVVKQQDLRHAAASL